MKKILIILLISIASTSLCVQNQSPTSNKSNTSGLSESPSCSASLSLMSSGKDTCTITSTITTSYCDNKTYELKNGGTKCSGITSGDSFSKDCSWTVSVGTYNYYLYINGSLKDSGPIVCKSSSKCSDGTLYDYCSATKPLYCSNGSLINKCSFCNCPSQKSCNTTSELCYAPLIGGGTSGGGVGGSSQTCSDGAVYGSCSSNKPKYCDNGNLIDKCSICECPSSQNCNITTDSCYTFSVNCSDGTLYNQCSSIKPRYCDNGNLTDDCTSCGCSSGQSCNSSTNQCYTSLNVTADYYVIGNNSGYYAINGSNQQTFLSGTNASAIINNVLNVMKSWQKVAFTGDFVIDSKVKVNVGNITMDFSQARTTTTVGGLYNGLVLYGNYIKLLGGHVVNNYQIAQDPTNNGGHFYTNLSGDSYPNIMIHSAYSIVDGIDFTGVIVYGDYASSATTVQNCIIHNVNANYAGFAGGGLGSNTIQDNIFYEFTKTTSIMAESTGAENNKILRNNFYGNHNHAIYFDKGSPSSTGNNEIAYNWFHDFSDPNGAALHIKIPNNNIHNNLFENWLTSYTISIYSEWVGYTANNNEIHHNTFKNCANAIVLGHGNSAAEPTTGNKVYNNVFQDCGNAVVLSAGAVTDGSRGCPVGSTCPGPVIDSKIYYNDFNNSNKPFVGWDQVTMTENTVVAYNYIDKSISLPAWTNSMIYKNTFFPPNTTLAIPNSNYNNITNPASWYYVVPRT